MNTLINWKLSLHGLLPCVMLLILAAPGYYKVQGVKRIDQDLYKTSSGLYIETKFCYHYTYGEDALLKWEGRYHDTNKIVWADESACQVDNIWTK